MQMKKAQPPHHLPKLHKDTDFLFPLSLDDLAKDDDSEFRIQYALECLLRHGNLRAADVSELLKKLQELRKWGASGKISQELDDLVKELPAVHRCNDGTLALSKVCSDPKTCLRTRCLLCTPRY